MVFCEYHITLYTLKCTNVSSSAETVTYSNNLSQIISLLIFGGMNIMVWLILLFVAQHSMNLRNNQTRITVAQKKETEQFLNFLSKKTFLSL